MADDDFQAPDFSAPAEDLNAPQPLVAPAPPPPPSVSAWEPEPTLPHVPPAPQWTPAPTQPPTQPMPTMAPASSVVVAVEPAKKSKKGILPWSIAAVFAIAAAAFAVLWIGKSGDADDLTKARDALSADKDTLTSTLTSTKGDLAAVTKDLAAAKASLESTKNDLDTANASNDQLTTQVTTLTSEYEALKNKPPDPPKAKDYAPRASLQLGKDIGRNASPALTDAEASCLGAAVIDRVGVDTLLVDLTGKSTPDSVFVKLDAAIFNAADDCRIDIGRLNGG